MPSHAVVRGDTLSQIAKQSGFRYWPNLYFAEENGTFRQKRPDPNRIYPGDVVELPPKGQHIAALESRPAFRHHKIPLFTQPRATTCWRAAAKMVFLWKHGRKAEPDFNRRIGKKYQEQKTGLTRSQWQDFYVNRLGMMGTYVSYENLLHYIVAIRSPAVVAAFTDNSASAHAVVITGYNLFRLQWYFLNPFSGAEYEFDLDGNATYTAGPATEKNMGYWININRTRLRSEVFHF